MGEMKTSLFVAVVTVVVFGMTSTAQKQISGGACILDVALTDMTGPHYSLRDLCRAAGDKVTVVVRCTSGSRYSSQANLNPCLPEEPRVSLQFDAREPSTNVTLLLWLNVPHDVLDSAMYTFTPLPRDEFSAHIVTGDLNYTRFHLTIAQRCVSGGSSTTPTTAPTTNAYDVTTRNNDVGISENAETATDGVMSKKTPPNHRAQIAGVLTYRHRRETEPSQQSHTPSLADSLTGSEGNSTVFGENTDLAKGKAEVVSEKNDAEEKSQHVQSNLKESGGSDTFALNATGDVFGEFEEVTSSGDGGTTDSIYASEVTTSVYDITRDITEEITHDSDITTSSIDTDSIYYVTQDFSEDITHRMQENSVSNQAKNEITAVPAGGPLGRPSDAEILMELIDRSRDQDTVSSAASLSRSPYTSPAGSPTARVSPTMRATQSTVDYVVRPSDSHVTLSTTPVPTFLRADDLFQDFFNPSDNSNSHTVSPSTAPLPTSTPSTGLPAGFSDQYTDVMDGGYYDDVSSNYNFDDLSTNKVNNVINSFNGNDASNFIIEAGGPTGEPFQGNTDRKDQDFGDVADFEGNDPTVSIFGDAPSETNSSTAVEVDVPANADTSSSKPSSSGNGSNDNARASAPRPSGRSLSNPDQLPTNTSSESPVQNTNLGPTEANNTVSAAEAETLGQSTVGQSTTATTAENVGSTASISNTESQSTQSGVGPEPTKASGEHTNATTVHETNIVQPTSGQAKNSTDSDNTTVYKNDTIATATFNSTETSPTVAFSDNTTIPQSTPSSSNNTSTTTPPLPNTFSPPPQVINSTLPTGSRGNISELALPPEDAGVESDTFWPIVAALVIGIPSIIVFGIAITVIHKRRLASPARLRAASMYPSLKSNSQRALHLSGIQRPSIDV